MEQITTTDNSELLKESPLNEAEKKAVDNTKKATDEQIDAKFPPKNKDKNNNEKLLTSKENRSNIIDYIDNNLNLLTASESDMVYVDMFKSILEDGASDKTLLNLNNIPDEAKTMVFQGIIENIQERTTKDEDFVNNMLNRKNNPKEYQKRANGLLEKYKIEGISVTNRKMVYTVDNNQEVSLVSGWFPPHDVRNGEMSGKYNPNIFKNQWTNQSLKNKGELNSRYFLVKEEEPKIDIVYDPSNIKKAISTSEVSGLGNDAKITVNLNDDFIKNDKGVIDMFAQRDKEAEIKNMIFVTNKNIKSENIKINFVNTTEVKDGANVVINIPEKQEVLGAAENIELTTQFNAAKSDINEGERKSQLINQFQSYLKQDENGKRVLDSNKYKILKINNIEGNASDIFDPNTKPEDALKKNEQYAKDRLNTAISFLNDIGTSQEIIDGASQTSQVRQGKNPADQNIKINWQVRKVITPKIEAYDKKIDVVMPKKTTYTWNVMHTMISNESKKK